MQVENNRFKHFGDRQQLPVPALRWQAFAAHEDKAFFSRFSSRETIQGGANLSSLDNSLISLGLEIPASLFPSPYWPRLRLGHWVGSEDNRRYFLGLGK